MNYFAVERKGKFLERVVIADTRNSNPAFGTFLNMSYDEMKNSEYLEEFVVAAMTAANYKLNGKDEETAITLIGEDGVFIWGIIMGPGDDGDIRYCLVDWHKDGKNYRYAE